MKQMLIDFFECASVSIITGLTVGLLTALVLLAAGCEPQSDVKLPEEFAQIRVVAQSQTFSSSLTVSKVEIDGSTYIIVSTGHGVAICRAPTKNP